MGDKHAETVVCLGSSTTASKGTYNWIDELDKRPRNRRFRFINLGVGGDLSFNVLKRVGRVIQAQPDRVIVLIGTNDVLASVFPNVRRFARVCKGVSEEPSPALFKRNLELLTRELRRATNSAIALSSLAPVGEDPHSADPTQALLNKRFSQYNGIIREVSSALGTHYIPFYEAFQEQLDRAKTTKPFTKFSFPAFYRDYVLREMIQRRSFDEISRINGWHFHIDGVHLNTEGGTILTDAVQEYLDS
jgi:lysophospholipase L1-like esterase